MLGVLSILCPYYVVLFVAIFAELSHMLEVIITIFKVLICVYINDIECIDNKDDIITLRCFNYNFYAHLISDCETNVSAVDLY